jgi:tetratricopeptide (TPR) repeat protein
VVLSIVAAALGAVFLFKRPRENVGALWELAQSSRNEADRLVQQQQMEPAELSCRQSLAALDRLLAERPKTRGYRRERAIVLDILGQSLAAQDRPDEADEAYKEEISLWANLIAEQPSSVSDRCRMAEGLNRAAALLREDGRWEEAESDLNRGRRLCQSVPDRIAGDVELQRHRVTFLATLASLFGDMGRRSAALDHHGQAVLAQKGIAGAPSGTREDRERLISLLLEFGRLLRDARVPADAERALIEARELSERLVTEDPGSARYGKLAAEVLYHLGELVRFDPTRYPEARELFQRALVMQERLVSQSPSDLDHLAALAATCGSLASLERDAKAFDAAESFYRKEISLRSRLERDQPRSLAIRFAHGRALHELADLLRERSQARDALPLEREAVQQLDRVYRQNVRDPNYRRAISSAFWELCAVELDCKDHRAAAKTVEDYLRIEPNGYEEALESARFLCRCERLCRADPSLAAPERDALARSYADRAASALRCAVDGGFRDSSDLLTSPAYDPLRGRDDFKDLVREVQQRVKELSLD